LCATVRCRAWLSVVDAQDILHLRAGYNKKIMTDVRAARSISATPDLWRLPRVKYDTGVNR